MNVFSYTFQEELVHSFKEVLFANAGMLGGNGYQVDPQSLSITSA